MSSPCKFKAHAIGAAVRLDSASPKKSPPAIAVSALSEVGGRSESKVGEFCFNPKDPGKGNFVVLRAAETLTVGNEDGSSTSHCLVKQVTLFGRVSAKVIQANIDRSSQKDGYKISTHDNKLDGLRIDKYPVSFTIDEGVFNDTQTPAKKPKDAPAPKSTSIIKDISFPKGKPEGVTIDGHTIVWPGFGTIFLGEICGGGDYRQITMIRVELEKNLGTNATRGGGTKMAALEAKGDGGSGGGGSAGSVGNGST